MGGPRFSMAPNCWAIADRAADERSSAAQRSRISLLRGTRDPRSPELRFYDPAHNVRPGEEQIARTGDGEFGAFQRFHRAPDRISPGIGLRIQIVIHVEYREFD